MIKWTIHELLVRYRLEPTLRDIFVEGKSDKDLFAWLLERAGCRDAKVFSIDSVNVPSGLLAQLGFSSGNKQRVIALASELNRIAGSVLPHATCIVDADEDRLLSRMISLPSLLWTDYACVESYLFDERHLTKFIHFVLGSNIDIKRTLVNYGAILRELFLIRGALLECKLLVRQIPFAGCCTKVNGEIKFDRAEFIIRLLNATDQREIEGLLIATIERLSTTTGPDVRHYMNGHDLLDLLHWDRRAEAHAKGLRTSDAVRAALFGCLEYDSTCNQPLFRALFLRVCQTS